MNTRQNGHFDIILCAFLRSCDPERVLLLWDELSVCVCICVCVCVCVSAQKTGPNWVLSHRQIYPYVCSSLTPTYWHFWTFYAPCSKCILAYVPPVHLFASNLPCSRFVLNESHPISSLPKIFISLLSVDENVNRFTSKMQCKESFRSFVSRVYSLSSRRQWKTCRWQKLFVK